MDAKVSEISPAVLGEGEDDDDVSTGAAGGHMPDEQVNKSHAVLPVRPG